MRPTDHFERFDPPIINENMLRRELERRAQRRQTILLAVAGALFEVLLVLASLLLGELYPALALGFICLAIISTAGSGVIAIVFTQKGGVSYGSTN